MSMGRTSRRVTTAVVIITAAALAGLGLGFALGLARPRFGPDGDRLSWDQP